MLLRSSRKVVKTKRKHAYCVEFVLSLHMMLYEHNVMDRLFEFKWILFLGSDVA